MSKSKADIIMANAVKYGLVNYRADTMEPVEPEDFTGLPICDDYVMDQNYSSELRQRIYEDMLKHFEADPKSMLNTQGTEIGVDMAVAGGDQTVYGRAVYDPEINQALRPEQTMKLYQWNSRLLSAYGDGDIIVMAETVDEARGKVFRQFKPLKEGNPFEDCYLQMLYLDDDEEYMHEYMKKLTSLCEDLDKEPMQPISDVICIRGSD